MHAQLSHSSDPESGSSQAEEIPAGVDDEAVEDDGDGDGEVVMGDRRPLLTVPHSQRQRFFKLLLAHRLQLDATDARTKSLEEQKGLNETIQYRRISRISI
jgi:hypothetical protein